MRRPLRLLIVVVASTAALLWLLVLGAHALIAALRLEAEPWVGCNPVIAALAILIGVVIAAQGLDTRRSGGPRSRSGRTTRSGTATGLPWVKLLIALSWIAAAFAIYLGSCLYPEGSS